MPSVSFYLLILLPFYSKKNVFYSKKRKINKFPLFISLPFIFLTIIYYNKFWEEIQI